MDIKQLQYFLTVCKYGSFSKASTSLYITQQGLSSTIKKIEEELGVLLFVRTPKGISLTDYAQLLVPYAEETCKRHESLLSEIESLKKSKLRKINIDISLGLMVPIRLFPLISLNS